MAKQYSNDEKKLVLDLYEKGLSDTQISRQTGIPRSTIYSMTRGVSKRNDFDPDAEIVEQNVQLAFQKQKLQDIQRVERKAFREFARANNTIEEMTTSILEVLSENNFSKLTISNTQDKTKPVGVMILSDLHINECIYDVFGNVFDIEVAAKRLRKYVSKSIQYFKSFGVTSIAVLLQGDLINSSRRLDEITSAATSRANAVFILVDLISQMIIELNQSGFNVTVASVVGNESRLNEFFDYSAMLASENFDYMTHNILSKLFEGSVGVRFLPIDDPLEKLVNVNGQNILMLHGNCHRGIARDSNIEVETEKLIARYAGLGISVRYVTMGHVHKANASSWYLRNASLPGNNNYSQKALNLNGRSSQSILLVWDNGDIDATVVDLQDYKNYEPYEYKKHLVSYNTKNENTGTVIIQSVLI